MFLDIYAIFFILLPIKAFALIEVDITRGNLSPCLLQYLHYL